jgi:hypothetical protein
MIRDDGVGCGRGGYVVVIGAELDCLLSYFQVSISRKRTLCPVLATSNFRLSSTVINRFVLRLGEYKSLEIYVAKMELQRETLGAVKCYSKEHSSQSEGIK